MSGGAKRPYWNTLHSSENMAFGRAWNMAFLSLQSGEEDGCFMSMECENVED